MCCKTAARNHCWSFISLLLGEKVRLKLLLLLLAALSQGHARNPSQTARELLQALLPVGRHTANKNGLGGNNSIPWLLLPSFSDGSWCFKSFRIQLWSGNEFSCLKSSCLKQLCSFFSLSGAWNQLLIERHKCTILWFLAGFSFLFYINSNQMSCLVRKPFHQPCLLQQLCPWLWQPRWVLGSTCPALLTALGHHSIPSAVLLGPVPFQASSSLGKRLSLSLQL